jgi:hypothetical protein
LSEESGTQALVDELLGYRITTSDTGHHSYAPASSRDHDDLLLVLTLALWIAERKPAPTPSRISVPTGTFPTHLDRFTHRWPETLR